MRSISFAWTTPAVIARRKTVTRRAWTERYARSIHAGDELVAWNKQPRFAGARRIGIVRVTADPTFESTRDAPDSDFDAEGFSYLQTALPGWTVDGLAPKALWRAWRLSPRDLWVVRFELVELFVHEVPAGTPGAPKP